MKYSVLLNLLSTQLYLSFVLCIGFVFSVNAQEFPPISSYTTEMYGADNQNWSIAQAEDQQIYVANNKGLLHFNGESVKVKMPLF